jgi:hypothetical protein
MPHLAASSSGIAGTSANFSKMPIAVATNKCFAAMKPIAIRMIASGVMTGIFNPPLLSVEAITLVDFLFAIRVDTFPDEF